jgi:hypothetical protein
MSTPRQIAKVVAAALQPLGEVEHVVRDADVPLFMEAVAQTLGGLVRARLDPH